MRILGIDSSTPGCSVALLNNDAVVAEQIADPRPSYSKYLLQMVDQVLKEGKSRLDDLDGFAVTIGPGSFTGLRIGVSLLKGFVLATVFESQKGDLHSLITESALSPEGLSEKIKVPTLFAGSGVERYREVFKNSLGVRFLERGTQPKFSTAAGAALLASRQFDHQKHFDLNQLKINYIRKSEAELSLGGSLAERRSNHGN